MKYFLSLFILILFIQISFAQEEENPLPYKFEEPKFDTAPRYPGGENAMFKYFADNIKYPEPEKSKGLEGSVSLKFIVIKEGKITKVEALNGTPGAPNFVKEAIRVLENMPFWIPATKKGKPVDAEYYLTVPFELN
ncbi:MAG: energy transducer TonB [Bacteroidia bacterium]